MVQRYNYLLPKSSSEYKFSGNIEIIQNFDGFLYDFRRQPVLMNKKDEPLGLTWKHIVLIIKDDIAVTRMQLQICRYFLTPHRRTLHAGITRLPADDRRYTDNLVAVGERVASYCRVVGIGEIEYRFFYRACPP